MALAIGGGLIGPGGRHGGAVIGGNVPLGGQVPATLPPPAIFGGSGSGSTGIQWGNWGSGSAQAQADSLGPSVTVKKVPINTKVQQNPDVGKVIQEYQDTLGQLGANTDADAISAMQRQRDVTSGMASEAAANAAMRGFSAGTGVNQSATNEQYARGAEAQAQLNAANVSDARRRRESLLGGAAGAALGGAANQVSQQGVLLDQAKLQQDTENFQAQLEAMRNQNAFQNQLAILNAMGSFYSGF